MKLRVFVLLVAMLSMFFTKVNASTDTIKFGVSAKTDSTTYYATNMSLLSNRKHDYVHLKITNHQNYPVEVESAIEKYDYSKKKWIKVDGEVLAFDLIKKSNFPITYWSDSDYKGFEQDLSKGKYRSLITVSRFKKNIIKPKNLYKVGSFYAISFYIK